MADPFDAVDEELAGEIDDDGGDQEECEGEGHCEAPGAVVVAARARVGTPARACVLALARDALGCA
jgi:hypothetical protein